MEIAMRAVGPLLMKLGGLLAGEFTLEKRVRKGIESLVTELMLMDAALRKVAKVPPDQLDEGVKIWARKVQELSYQMEDIVDAFVVRLEDGGEPSNPKNRFKKLLKKATRLFKKGKDLHQISDALEEVVGQAKLLAELRRRYEQDIPDNGAGASVDPRVMALYTDVTELVGIEDASEELINMLIDGEDWLKHPLKTVSVVGFGGLGKTTLAKSVHDKIKVQFDCDAFVSVSQNPDMKKIFKDILYELDKDKYAEIHSTSRDERQLIDTLIDFLHNKRYLIVIDDIWDEKAWKLIKCAFSKKSLGSRLITTTRILSVSKACCSSSDDIFRMKPLSDDISRRLFYKRVFCNEDGCPPELVQVSKDILRKCGGVPLAIISIASLLASNSQIEKKEQWYDLLSSIGRGLTEDQSVDEMRKILLFSYYDLPSYLKPCLLYLSIFPEDHKIIRDELIWKWISEGFVYSQKQESSLYELGDSYFSELVNRSMILPIDIDAEEKVQACRVHDIVLDLICSLSSEVNFITVLDGAGRKMHNSQSKVHRLSIQNSKVDMATTSIAQVRSLTIFADITVDHALNISSYQVLRVLDLRFCDISNIGYLGNLLHLRYLGLYSTDVEELPMDIGKLQFLQTLDLRRTRIKELPSSAALLRQLMCLHVDKNMKLPSGIGNLTSLEVLIGLEVGKLSLRDFNLHVVKELGHLTKLRELDFGWVDLNESRDKAMVESLNNLHNLECLVIYVDGGLVDLMREGWVPSLRLRTLAIRGSPCSFKTLPTWINPSSLPLISHISISVEEVRSQDIQLLGMLPFLRYLLLRSDAQFSGNLAVEISGVTTDAFPCAARFEFLNISVVPSVFPQGAAPRLKHLRFAFPATWMAHDNFDLGMGHLPSLENVLVSLLCKRASDRLVNEAEAALRAAVDDHPNRPVLSISRW